MRSAYIHFMALFVGALATPLAGMSPITSLKPRDIDGDITCEGFEEAEEEASYQNFKEGIGYLKGLTEDGKVCGAGAGQCTRVSCSWNCAVYLCNDSDEDNNDVECAAVAESVERLREDCGEKKNYNHHRVLGYQSGPDGLSVHVGKNEC